MVALVAPVTDADLEVDVARDFGRFDGIPKYKLDCFGNGSITALGRS